MMKNSVNFNQAMSLVCSCFHDNSSSLLDNYFVFRDIQGRFRILANVDDIPTSTALLLTSLGESLHHYAAEPFVQNRNDLFNPDEIFTSKDIINYTDSSGEVVFKLVDRTITGSGWSTFDYCVSDEFRNTPKLSFFGLKGGVGRSTALTILAYELAKKGKKVLLLDFDIESPGLSSLILPEDVKPASGVVDWIIESNFVTNENNFLEDLIGFSPLAENTPGSILVIPAIGRDRTSYIDKLSRVYSEAKGATFNFKLIDLVEKMIKKESPDFILIDSRSGLHDIAALSIVGLSDSTLLFGIDSLQSWQGYETLFSFWKNRASVARNVREKLKIVQSFLPEQDQLTKSLIFRQKSYSLFTEYLYDAIEPEHNVESNQAYDDYFTFEEQDDVAPHYPIRIKWDNRFQEFNPLLLDEGIIPHEYLEFCFGELINWVEFNFLINRG